MNLTARPGRPTTLLKAVALLLLLIAAGSIVRFAHATPATIIDTTPGTAIVDGVINAGEYSGSTEGINASAGRVIGAGSYLFVDSGGASNELVFGLRPGGNLVEFVVIYIDSVSGGFGDTTGFQDMADFDRQAVSGSNLIGDVDLYFAPEFEADYAIVLRSATAELYQLASGGDNSLIHLKTLNLTPLNDATAGEFELSMLMSDVGLAPGDSFKYFATLVRPVRAMYRFNEFNGISQATYDAEAANLQSGFNLASGDYHTFMTMGPTAVDQLAGITILPTSNPGVPLLFLIVVVLLSAGSLLLIRRDLV